LHPGQNNSEQHQKQTKMIAQEPGKHLFLDVTGPFPLSIGRSKYHAKIMGHFSQKMWIAHIKAKTPITDLAKQHLDAMKAQGKLSHMHHDNTPEHGNKLANFCNDPGINQIHHTIHTSQHNGMVE